MAGNFFQKYAAGGALRPDSFTGMQPAFATALQAMFAGAPADIAPQLQVYSGYRSPERQAALYQKALAAAHEIMEIPAWRKTKLNGGRLGKAVNLRLCQSRLYRRCVAHAAPM